MDKNVEKGCLRRNDLLLLAALLVVAALIFVGWRLMHRESGGQLIVEVDGTRIAGYPLDIDGVYEIQGYRAGTNTLTVSGGSARITSSTCPDHLCEHQGSVSRNGETIVCLPNRVIVRVTGAKDNDVDIQLR